VTAIALSRLHYPVTALGPGRRVGIWFQGCSIRCPGCISADTWATGCGGTTVAAVLDAVSPWLVDADGITISGGEPFDQPEALAALLRGLRLRSDGDILVYSGYPFDALQPWLDACDGLIDALITGPLRIDQPQTLDLRGSDNQSVHRLTPLGRQRYTDQPMGPPRLDLMFDSDGSAWFAGIPRRGDLQRLRQLVAVDGHRLAVSEHPAADTER
jgi:anaerobic ribonucleoside-triphosphate reductase activating protein